jgi:hypothetical protein
MVPGPYTPLEIAPDERTPAVVPSEVPTLEPEILYWFPSLVAWVLAESTVN